MSQVLCVYATAPNFPATEQAPTATRYQVGNVWVDAIGGQPTQAEIDAVLNPDIASVDLAILNTALTQPGSVVRALALLLLQELNTLRTKVGLSTYTQPQLVAALQAKMQ